MATEPGDDDFQPIDGNGSSSDDGFRSFGDGNEEFIDPARAIDRGDTAGGGTDTPSGGATKVAGKRRGRKPGTTNKAKTAQVDLSSVEALLLTVHTGLSVVLKAPEFELTEEEAHKIAEAGTRVSRHYNMTATAKSIDFANLMIVLGTAYGSRFMAMKMRRDMERDERKKAAQSPNVRQIFPDGSIPASQ
jgi:hypothetical protein